AEGRRYRFGHQPQIAHWNLSRLAESLVPVFPSLDPLHHGLDRFVEVYTGEYSAMMAAKFGLHHLNKEDGELVAEAFELLHRAEVDMTLFFRKLAEIDAEAPSLAPLAEAFYSEELRNRYQAAWQDWLSRYAERLRQEGAPAAGRRARMNAANPRFVLRNYLAQEAIDLAEQGDVSRVHELLDLMRRPYDEQPERGRFAAKRPDWARERAGCSMLSCSS
ncbi:MAG: YdiU family protein, partial [Hydrogenophilaceae bacterium]|nr:YdiU family protein [Hydrogenophilaceae bacterium]